MKSTGTEDIAYSSRSKHQAKIRKNVVFNNSVITLIIYSFNIRYLVYLEPGSVLDPEDITV